MNKHCGSGHLPQPQNALNLNTTRFFLQSARFMDAYHKGLNGTQAAWSIKKYRGH
ncbi:hypothetical protein PAXRUDRAFT_166772 [Paxillus rubicundulus Ve08.2h10]|uniref:Uncharacterized protein n=1 Tax=Paxillus rubicundulus Ve08.2h10 TaxID=930991 RepID=A0A0D0D1M9_9AGAM|nr:hypothetical protein PAXRUDRAFT_166772 [Paxillus rubicundulus Ve08.2h10]